MTNKITFCSLVLASTFTLAAARGASAQTAATPGPEAGVAATPAPPKPASVDPNIDRGFILPTAMTQPKGSITYNNYELLLHGVTYGITDHVQASLTVLSPVVKEMPLVASASIKARLVDAGRLHLSLQGSGTYAHEGVGSSESDSDAQIVSVGAGAFASLCLREDCSSLLSTSATYQLAMLDGLDQASHMVVYGGSVVHRVGRHLKLLGEITSATGRAPGGSFDNLGGALVSYGVRFHNEDIAGDIGFIKPISSDGDGGDFLLGLPFVSVSYRWQ